MNLDFAKYQDLAIQYGTKFLIAIVLLYIGWKVIGMITKMVTKALDRAKLDATLQPVIASTFSMLLKIMLLIAVASTLGVQATSFVAVLGALTLAIGMAWQGSLGNLAGGVLILFFRPMEVGDYIKAQGVEGFVKEIQLFTTVIETPDKSTIYLPNGTLANGNIENVSQVGQVRLHLPVGISYDADIKQARKILMQVLKNNSMVLQDPAPSVAVVNLGDSSVDLDLRPWCEPGNAPAVTVNILEEAKIALDEANISIPYPHQVVYMHNENSFASN